MTERSRLSIPNIRNSGLSTLDDSLGSRSHGLGCATCSKPIQVAWIQ